DHAAGDRTDQPAGARFPNVDRPGIAFRGGGQLTVPAIGQGPAAWLRSADGLNFPAGNGIPDLQNTVRTAHGQAPAVLRKSHADEHAAMPQKSARVLAGPRIPNMDISIPAGGSQVLAVRTVSHATDRPVVPLQSHDFMRGPLDERRRRTD